MYAGLYELPGGKVEFGEDPKAVLQRLILSQTGREVEALHIQDVYSHIDSNDSSRQYIDVAFTASLQPGTSIDIGESHDKYVWKKMSEIQLNEVTETTRQALQMEKPSVTTPKNDNVVVGDTTVSGEVIIYADGGSRGNPGQSASGFVIKDADDRVLFKGGEYVGITTNNQAEYQAVKLALEKALELGAKKVKLRLDSLLVVNQLNGSYKIRNRDLWSIHMFIKDLIGRFESFSVSHVRREFNKEADAMVNKILDEHDG